MSEWESAFKCPKNDISKNQVRLKSSNKRFDSVTVNFY